MPVEWPFAKECLNLGGVRKTSIDADAEKHIDARDAERQTVTASEILKHLGDQPGIVLADEVGMGKTYVALAVAASVLVATKGKRGPVVVMVPSGLRGKWQREWRQFKHHCAADHKLDWIKDTFARSPTDFFKLIDDKSNRRHLVFMTTGCFSQQRVRDPWIKLAMIRMARRYTKLTPTEKRRLYRWATKLVQLATVRGLDESVVERLLNTDLSQWQVVLKSKELGILNDDADDPIPDLLKRYETKQKTWKPLIEVIRHALPHRSSGEERDRERMKETRKKFHDACEDIFKQWLQETSWESPLLILDEAHHAKNDQTNLAELFRESSRSDTQLLSGKFQRMLFLTATPFQLGHLELINILKSFGAIQWKGRFAPGMKAEEFDGKINDLEIALNNNRKAGRDLDKLWGSVHSDMLGESGVDGWWERVGAQPKDDFENRLKQAIEKAKQTRDEAQSLLWPWIVRHNRPATLTSSSADTGQRRRVALVGRAILDTDSTPSAVEAGLPVEGTATLPFLLTARVQGELANCSGARAYFAEGLASSYEAFHHTREDRTKSRDLSDDGSKPDYASDTQGPNTEPLIPMSWYEEQISNLIPSQTDSRDKRLEHPKVRATVERAVKLWSGGEKVLIFCYYRKTCLALYQHIRDEVEAETGRIAAKNLGLEYAGNETTVQEEFERARRRLSQAGPLHQEVEKLLSGCLDSRKYAALKSHSQRQELLKILTAYFRSSSFIAHALPLNDPAVLRQLFFDRMDQSKLTGRARVEQFLNFAVELAEHSQCVVPSQSDEQDNEDCDPLAKYLEAVAVCSRPRRDNNAANDDRNLDLETADDEVDDEGSQGRASYRAAPLVRIVHGDTKSETREKLALAFNSPLFPEILVSSSVMGEGIDLHRFCRHVIHHDGCWNPSTLEQQTGRLDRIRCKAETSSHPIVIYQPFIAGSADEKMFRVLRDRERWFKIVMGQKFVFDEATSEAIAVRVPLPDSLAKELTFNLTRWQPPTTTQSSPIEFIEPSDRRPSPTR